MTDSLVPNLLLWALVLTILVAHSWKGGQYGVGLVFAYCFQMWLVYWLGAFLHALPWSTLPEPELTRIGFDQATYGLLAFSAGYFLSAGILRRRAAAQSGNTYYEPDPKLPAAYIVTGLIFYFVLIPVIGRLPSLNALSAVGSQLIVVGICLGCWQAWLKGSARQLTFNLMGCLLMPAVTLMTQGFLGYGTISCVIVLVFIGQFFRPRWALVATAAVMAYGGLSFYVSYMQARNELRATIWGGESYVNRMSRTWAVVTSTEPFSLYNPEHLEPVDSRINQNMLVGAVVTNLANTADFAHGETLRLAAIAMIPRAVWPNKPMVGGSGNLVSRFSGLEFAEGTSVGIGPVMEFYANFGTAGVLCGFFLLGIVVTTADVAAAMKLHQGNWQGFSYAFVVGIALLNVGGSLMELSSGAAASMALGSLMNQILRNYQRVRHVLAMGRRPQPRVAGL